METELTAALVEAGATLEYIRDMIQQYVIDYHPNTVAKQTPFTLPAMIYGTVCDALSRPVLRDLLAARVRTEPTAPSKAL